MNHRCRYELRWIPHTVAKVFADLGIRTRSDLARTMGWPISTTYRTFKPDWSGTAPDELLAEVSGRLKIEIADLVEPVPTDPFFGLTVSYRRVNLNR